MPKNWQERLSAPPDHPDSQPGRPMLADRDVGGRIRGDAVRSQGGGGTVLNPLFVPSYISGLQALYDANLQPEFMRQRDGARLSRIFDTSGNGRDAIQASVSLQRVLRLSASGWAFGPGSLGNNGTCVATFTSIAQPLTIVTVHSTRTALPNQSVYSSKDTVECAMGLGSGFNYNINAGNPVGIGDSTLKTEIISVTFNGASSFGRINGVQSANVNAGANSLTNGITISGNFTQSGAWGDDIFFIAIWNRALTTAEFQSLERLYLGPRFNIQVA